MNELQKKWIEDSQSYLVHYNHNHDKLGRFARSNGGAFGGSKDLGSMIIDGFKQRKKDKKRKAAEKQTRDKPITKEELAELEEMEREDEILGKQGYKVFEKNLSPEEAKHVITDKEFSTFEKNPKTKSIKDVHVAPGYDFTTGHRDISIEGTSTTRKWKSEEKSLKTGVHLIKENPQTVIFNGVEHESGAGIDKRKLKQLDSFAASKEVSNALREGRKMGPINASNDQWPTTYSETNKKQSENDWSPVHVTYGFSDKGKPVIISAEYYHKNVEQDSHILTVYFDEKLKLNGSNYDG